MKNIYDMALRQVYKHREIVFFSLSLSFVRLLALSFLHIDQTIGQYDVNDFSLSLSLRLLLEVLILLDSSLSTMIHV